MGKDAYVSAGPSDRPKYWTTLEQGEAIRAQLGLIRDGSRVLEVGTAAGHVTQLLNQKGAAVTGIEMDESLGALAAPLCERMIIGDVEALDLDAHVPDTFDVILCGDVLEHLRNPGAVLCKLRRRLVPDGYLVVSLPNVAHASVRLDLLAGEFKYVREGLLDATHLRFFTLASIVELFNKCGFEIKDLYRARQGPFDTEIHVSPLRVSAFAFRNIMKDSEATSYQFVFRAVPSERANTLIDFADPTFDSARQLRQLSIRCMKEARAALRRPERDHIEARAWSRLAFVCCPSAKAIKCWLASLSPTRVWGTD